MGEEMAQLGNFPDLAIKELAKPTDAFTSGSVCHSLTNIK